MKINFGISSYSRHSPGVPWEERVKEVPEQGELERVPSGFIARYLPAVPERFLLDNYANVREGTILEQLPAVRFNLKEDYSHSLHELYLVWIKERGEWVVFWHHWWSEGDFSIDESESGPFALDHHCLTMLEESFHIPDKTLSLEQAITTSPVELEKLASR